MHTVHRLYSWIAFPLIATVYIAMQLLIFAFNMLNNFTHYIFFEKIEVPEMPDFLPDEASPKFNYMYRFAMAFFDPFEKLFRGLKGLKEYEF